MKKNSNVKNKLFCVTKVVLSFTLVMSLFCGVTTEAKSKLKLSTKKIVLNVGTTKTIKISGKRKSTKLKFSSSKKSVATVTNAGKVKAKKKGTAKISVKYKDKKKFKLLGTVKVTIKPKDDVKATNKATNNSNIPTPAPSNKPSSTDNKPSATPTASPTQTPDKSTWDNPFEEKSNYKKEVFTITIDAAKMEFNDVAGSKKRGMWGKGTAEFDSSLFTQNESGEVYETAIFEKDGKCTNCIRRFVFQGRDSAGKNTTLYIDCQTDTLDSAIVNPAVVASSKNLSWLETADLKMYVESDESHVIEKLHFYQNENATEPSKKIPAPVIDAADEYTEKLFTFNITVGAYEKATGTRAVGQFLHFTGDSDCENFKGNVLGDCVDARLKYKDDGIETLSAVYVMEGVDSTGKKMKIFVMNNGIDTGTMTTKPVVITDNPDWAWIEDAPLRGIADTDGGLKINIFTKKR